ncbi:hypothetical protein RMR10_004470 [Agrobacterium rosae]|uniref:hypothetical protein n=1 Tax=Agrobacterium rosae TaxID=1972867 RepID=UPI002A0E7C66|nr:hypothetical protein [Agrobacterium rosae]MDX8315624.1 hypothetical protein [Agrobacterium rosae]
MSDTATLYDKTGAAFKLDHEHNGTLYVRPLVKVVMQTNYGDDFHEEEDFEPAAYIVAKAEDELFYAPPVEALNADIKAKTEEIEAIKSAAKKAIQDLNTQKFAAESGLRNAKRQLEDWMQTHKGMIDLGKLLDGKILFPLSVEESRYHGAWNVPSIPKMNEIHGLRVEGGDFEKGREWRTKRYLSDHYHTSFQFFDTEEERAAVISSAFEDTCKQFRLRPDFSMQNYSSTLSYGLLLKWVETHPALSIPDDIKEMKAANEAALVEQRKAALAAELASMESGKVGA